MVELLAAREGGDRGGEVVAGLDERVAQARLEYRDNPAVLAGLDAYVERLKEEGSA